MKKNFLQISINEKLKAHNLEEESIRIDTIRTRIKRGQVDTMVHSGPKSPAEELETLLVSRLLQPPRMRSPLNTAEALELANSLKNEQN